MKKPDTNNSTANKEMDKLGEQFDKFESDVNQMTLDRMNTAPKQELEPQTKLATSEIDKQKEIYLKPFKTIRSQEKFNENYRSQYEFDKEYVHFIAENNEIKGEDIDMWTKPYPGVPAEEWKVPVNKPVWGPRYLAEQIKRRTYHRLVMNEKQTTGADGHGQYFGSMAVDTTIQRLDARPVTSKRSVFMGLNDLRNFG